MKLYFVGLPIGNLEDITIRAINVLKSVDLIFCEDTREFIKIAKTYDIKAKYESFHDFNEIHKTDKIIDLLCKGLNIAIVSDRGMPTISDPGFFLIKKYTEFLNYDINGKILIVPGVSAVTASVSLCIFDSKFLFWGFAKEKHLESLNNIEVPMVFFESPHRINEFLDIAYRQFGERKVMICKEITKHYENFTYGNLKTLRLEDPKGEFTVIIEGKKQEDLIDLKSVLIKIKSMNLDISNKDLSKILALIYAVSKKDIYNQITQYS